MSVHLGEGGGVVYKPSKLENLGSGCCPLTSTSNDGAHGTSNDGAEGPRMVAHNNFPVFVNWTLGNIIFDILESPAIKKEHMLGLSSIYYGTSSGTCLRRYMHLWCRFDWVIIDSMLVQINHNPRRKSQYIVLSPTCVLYFATVSPTISTCPTWKCRCNSTL